MGRVRRAFWLVPAWFALSPWTMPLPSAAAQGLSPSHFKLSEAVEFDKVDSATEKHLKQIEAAVAGNASAPATISPRAATIIFERRDMTDTPVRKRMERSSPAAHSHLVEAVAQRLLEDVDGTIDLVGRNGERRRDTPH